MHKSLKNGLPPFRPILSATGTPAYKLGKLLFPVPSDITQNEFTVKDSFIFVETILNQDSDLRKKLFQTSETLVKGISKNDFRDLLNLATKESFFTFNNKFYIQVDGVTMGSILSPILANIFLSHHQENWLNK